MRPKQKIFNLVHHIMKPAVKKLPFQRHHSITTPIVTINPQGNFHVTLQTNSVAYDYTSKFLQGLHINR